MSSPTDQPDALAKLLNLVESMQTEVQRLGQQKDNEYQKLEGMILRFGKTLEEHGTTLDVHTRQLFEIWERTDAHQRIIQALTDQGASNAAVLTKHAELLTAMAEAVAGVRDRTREAMESVSEAKATAEDFKQAVTLHIDTFTKKTTESLDGLKSSDDAQNAELLKLSGGMQQVTKQGEQTLAALGVTETEGEKTPPGKLDQLKDANKRALLYSAFMTVAILAKVVWDVFFPHK